MRIVCLTVLLSASWAIGLCPAVPRAKAAEPGDRKLAVQLVSRRVTGDCRRSIERGTKFLVSAMRVDGAVGVDLSMPPDMSCTAIFGLALLSQGNTLSAGTHMVELRKVTDAVLDMVDHLPSGKVQQATITLVERKIGRNADLFLSALFLSQLLGEASYAENDVREALEKLVEAICQAQQRDGTWGEESWAPVLGTVLGWESLRASSSAGLRVDASATAAGQALLKQLQAKPADNQHWMFEFYKNASSIRVLYSMNYRHEPAFEECVKRIIRIAHEDDRPFVEAGGEEFLAFFLVTECMLQEREESWQSWYPTVRDKLIRIQNADGSWSGHHCITARTFCTAAALLTLQAANLYMPASNL